MKYIVFLSFLISFNSYACRYELITQGNKFFISKKLYGDLRTKDIKTPLRVGIVNLSDNDGEETRLKVKREFNSKEEASEYLLSRCGSSNY